MGTLWQDIRFALRQLRRNPVFTLAALGARRADVVGAVIRHSLALAAPGIVLGLAGSLAASRAPGGFLYQVAPTDPMTLVLVCTAVAVLVPAAALAPACRAAGTDPMLTLRGE